MLGKLHEDCDIKTAMDRIRGLAASTKLLVEDIETDIEVDAISGAEDPDKFAVSVSVGDYDLYIYPDGEAWWNYRPKVLKNGEYDCSLYQNHVDPSRIRSFTMPPASEEKENDNGKE